jgi:hypothetical protein
MFSLHCVRWKHQAVGLLLPSKLSVSGVTTLLSCHSDYAMTKIIIKLQGSVSRATVMWRINRRRKIPLKWEEIITGYCQPVPQKAGHAEGKFCVLGFWWCFVLFCFLVLETDFRANFSVGYTCHWPCAFWLHLSGNMDVCTRWFKYDRDKLWLVYTQIVPVIFEPPCTLYGGPESSYQTTRCNILGENNFLYKVFC